MRINKKHYQAAACIVWCYDWRFQRVFKQFLISRQIKTYDLICVAGGAKSLASPTKLAEQKFILQQISTSIRLHKTKQIILMNHSDCGGYGGLKSFANNLLQEKHFHKTELHRAKNVISNKLKIKLPIKCLWVDFTNWHFV